VGLAPLDVRDEAHAASIVLVARIVETLFRRAAGIRFHVEAPQDAMVAAFSGIPDRGRWTLLGLLAGRRLPEPRHRLLAVAE